MWDTIRRLFLPPVFAGDEEKTRLAALLNATLWTFVALDAVAILVLLFLPNPASSVPFVALTMLGELIALWLMRRGHVSAAALLFLAGLWILLTVLAIFLGGTQSVVYYGSIVVVVTAGLLLGGRGGVAFAGLSVAAGLGIALAESADLLPPAMVAATPLSQWIAHSVLVLAAAGLLNVASRGLNEALRRARRYAAELEEQRTGLEVAVQERTHDLARRARYLEATAAIAREAVSELELDGLITSAVNSISRQFGFYHTGLFLLDATGEWAELKAASSEGGKKMLARGHRLRVGQEGLVGYVSQRGEPRIALDTGQEAVFFDNPDLPQTRSEATLPLRVRGQVIGVLDVQSAEPEAFTPEDIAVLQTLADQIATAINNARLFRQVEESIEVERRAYGELVRQKWAELLRAQASLGFASTRQAVVPAGEAWTPHMKMALESGQIVSGQDAAAVAIPIKVRDRVIGVIDGKKRGGSGQWTDEELTLLQTFAEHAAIALESARLYQDVQRRAAEERLVGEVTARLGESLDVQQVLQTAVREIGELLDLHDLTIQLEIDEDRVG